MPIFPCEHCGGSYELAEEDVGSTVVCPHCNEETTSTPVPQESGAAAMAREYTQRMEAENVAHKLSPVVWLLPLSALVVTALVHVLMVAVYMNLKPLPLIVVFWLPALVGTVVGLNLFNLATKSSNVDIPKWATPLALVMAIVVSMIPIVITKNKYNLKVRRALIVDVNKVLQPPSLPEGTATCLSVSIPEPMESGAYTFDTLLKGGETHLLAGEVALYKASLLYDSRMKALQRELVQPYVKKALNTCIEQYPHLMSLEMEPLKVKDTPKLGIYVGDVVFNTKLKLSYQAKVRKVDVDCHLVPESHIRAKAIPQATALWKRFDPSSDSTCADVTLGDKIDESYRQADAVLSDDQEVPIIIREDSLSEGSDKISVFFQFREAVIMRINEKLQTGVNRGGREGRCVNIDQKRLLRKHESSLRAIFPESEPLMVLAKEDGYSVDVVTGEHKVLLAAKTQKASSGWSLIVPAHYIPTEGSEFVRIVNSEEDKLNISIETKPINAYAKFSLIVYAQKERTDWAEGHLGAEIEDVKPWETTSGLSGYRYATRKGDAIRIKYFFTHGTNLAILSAVATESTPALLETSDSIVRSLRFKDVPDESLADAK